MDKFHREWNGYKKEEVNQFIQDTITKLEGMLNKSKVQEQRLIELEKSLQESKRKLRNTQEQLAHYQMMESNLKKALLQAENTSNHIKKMATEEGNMIIENAKQNANRIVNDALLRAEKIEIQTDTLERNMRIFKKKLRLIVEQQMAVVEEIETLDLK